MQRNPVIKPTNIRIMVIGNKEVGKTCVVKRFCEKRFVDRYNPTVGLDYGVIHIGEKEGVNLHVHFFDLSGYSLFYEVRNEFYGEANGLVLMFDLGNPKSFLNLNMWLDEIAAFLGGEKMLQRKAIVICGNKKDKSPKISSSDGKMLANIYGFDYFETSALSGKGVCEMFEELFKKIVTLEDHAYCPPLRNISVGYTKEQLIAVCQLRWGQEDHEKLGLRPGATKDEINRVYRRLAVLLHPDKCAIPGSEEAFKNLVSARALMLHRLKH